MGAWLLLDDRPLVGRRRIGEWLRRDGVVLMDVASPFSWVSDGDSHDPDPARGYDHRSTFSGSTTTPSPTARSTTGGSVRKPERVHSQTLHCYTPADFVLLEGTGLRLDHLEVGGEPIALDAPHTTASLLWTVNEYLVRLTRL